MMQLLLWFTFHKQGNRSGEKLNNQITCPWLHTWKIVFQPRQSTPIIRALKLFYWFLRGLYWRLRGSLSKQTWPFPDSDLWCQFSYGRVHFFEKVLLLPCSLYESSDLFLHSLLEMEFYTAFSTSFSSFLLCSRENEILS